MAAKITKRRCAVIAGAPEADVQFIMETVKDGDFVVCADRGFEIAELAGIKPDLIVGDFDSCKTALPSDCEISTLNPEKDDTDALHCVSVAFERGYRDFVLLNATGGRLDHCLGNISILDYLSQRGAEGIILSENEEIILLTEGEHIIPNRKGRTFSVFPFGCEAVTLSYGGAKYPLSREPLFSSVARGVSNIFVSDSASITVHSGKALLIINATKSIA